jgi:transposase-like protein
VPDCSRAAPRGIIRGRIEPGSVIHSGGRRGYDGPVDTSHGKHYRVRHGEDELASQSCAVPCTPDGRAHVNGIESFRGHANTKPARFRGLQKHAFHLHLKEREFRFNHRRDDLYALLLREFRKSPL